MTTPDTTPQRKKIKIPVALMTHDGTGGGLLLFVLEPRRPSEDDRTDYEVEFTLVQDLGHNVRLERVEPLQGTGTAVLKSATGNRKKLTYDIDVAASPGVFAYDLAYLLDDADDVCYAYARWPSGKPTCDDARIGRNPPPEIIVP